MRQLTVGGTRYTLKADRDISAVMKAAKAKPKMTRQKQCARYFPLFISGQTSTMDYVRSYWAGNNFDMATYAAFFGGKLSPLPAPVYDPALPLVECETLEGEQA
jgi:hypothetical protein